MATIASLAIDVIAQTTKLTRPLTQAAAHVEKFSDSVQRHLERAEQAAERLEKRFQAITNAGKRAGAGLAALAAAGLGLIKLSSDAEETMAKMGQVFGSLTDEIDTWAIETAQAMGRSRQQMRQYVTDTQAILAPLLGDGGVAAEMSKSIAALAVDLASFMNAADDDAWRALISGLTGETEPMKRFGVILTETALEQFRLAEGIQKSVREMTEAEKVQLRFRMIMERLKLAHGDAIRNADSWANTLRSLTGELRNAGEELGDRLLPTGTRIIAAIRDAVRQFNSLDSQTKGNIVMLGVLTAGLLGVVAAFGLLAAGAAMVVKAFGILGAVFGFLTSPIGLVIAAVVLFATAWENNWLGIRNVTETVWDAISDIFEVVSKNLSVVWKWTAKRLGDAWDWLSGPAWEWIKDTAWPALTQAFSVAWQWTAKQLGKAWDWLSGPAWEWIRDTGWPKLTSALSVAWEWIVSKAGDAWEWLSGPAWEWIRDTAWPKLTTSVSTAWRWVVDRAGDAWEWLSGPAWDWIRDTAWPALTKAFSVAWQWTAEKLGSAWDWVENTLIPWVTGPAWEALKQGFKTTWEWVVDASDSVLKWIKDTAWPYIQGTVKTTWEWTVSFVGALYDAIVEGFRTGDWSRAIGISADAWRTGMKIWVTLELVQGAVAGILTAIQTGLGLISAAAGAAGRGLGAAGVLGVISIGVALAEAMAEGDYKKFGADLIAALAAGIGIGVFTGSPYAGALAFTIVLNFEIGSWIADELPRKVDELIGKVRETFNRPDLVDIQLEQQAAARVGLGPSTPQITLHDIMALTTQNAANASESMQSLAETATQASRSLSELERITGLAGIERILDAIYVAEGGASASVPYGVTGFKEQGYRFLLAQNQALFDRIVQEMGLEPFSEEWYRASAAVTVTHWWEHFEREFLGGADATFAELAPEVQARFIRYLAEHYAPPSAHPLNQFWPINVGRLLGLPGFAEGGWTGNIPTDEIAGFVHGQEIVIPAKVHRRGLGAILEFLGIDLPGYQAGLVQQIPGLPASTQAGLSGAAAMINSIANQLNGIVDLLERGIEAILNLVEITLLDLARRVLPEEQYKALEERVLSLTRALRDGWESFRSLFQATEEQTEAAKSAADGLNEADEAARKLQQFVTSELQAAILQRLPVIQRALQGWEQGRTYVGTTLGAVIGALIAVSFETEAAALSFEMLNTTLGAAVDALSMLLEPILPLVHVLQTVLVPVFTVIGQTLQALLLPIMPTLFEGLKWLGVVVLLVAEAFQRMRHVLLDALGKLVEGIGRVVDALPFISAQGMIQAGKNLQQAAAEAAQSAADLAEARADLIGLTYEEALARAREIEAIDRATESLINVPISMKALNRLRWEAVTPQLVPSGNVAVMQAVASGHAQAAGEAPIYVNIEHVEFQDSRDFEQWLKQHQYRQALINVGTPATRRRV